jgi:hypothetical protein
VKKTLIITALVALLFGFYSCSSEDDVELAVAYEKTLSYSDISHLFEQGISAKDSIELLNESVKNWIQQQSVLNAIQQDSSVNLSALEKKIERIRNELIILEYKKLLLKRDLDTTVSEKELKKYYLDNQPEFKLEHDIIQGYMIQIPKNSQLLYKVNNILKSPLDSSSRSNLDTLLSANSPSYVFTDSMWVNFDNFILKTPFENVDHYQFMTHIKKAVKSDLISYYLLGVTNYKVKGDLAPFEYYKEGIRAKIISDRKLRLVSNIETDLYTEALKSDEIEIFIK